MKQSCFFMPLSKADGNISACVFRETKRKTNKKKNIVGLVKPVLPRQSSLEDESLTLVGSQDLAARTCENEVSK